MGWNGKNNQPKLLSLLPKLKLHFFISKQNCEARAKLFTTNKGKSTVQHSTVQYSTVQYMMELLQNGVPNLYEGDMSVEEEVLDWLIEMKVGISHKEMSSISWLTNSALVYEPKCGLGSQPMKTCTSTYSCAHGAQINFWRSNSIFYLWYQYSRLNLHCVTPFLYVHIVDGLLMFIGLQ